MFVADDKFSDVIIALERRGWHRSGYANSPNFRLKWRNLSNINFRLLRNDQVRGYPALWGGDLSRMRCDLRSSRGEVENRTTPWYVCTSHCLM